MLRTIWSAQTSLNAMQDKLDSISNNIANSSTNGYKKIEVGFKDLLQESLDRQGYPIKDKNSIIGTGTQTSTWYRNYEQGNLQASGNPSDLAVDGDGFFKVISNNGEEYYRRDGSFHIDSLGRLADSSGNILEIKYTNNQTQNTLDLNNSNFTINNKGEIYKSQNGTTIKVGEINTYSTLGSDDFLSIGDNLYKVKESAQIGVSNSSSIYQGYTELSNVDISKEFTDMIITQRAFQLGIKSLQTGDEIWGMVNNLRR